MPLDTKVADGRSRPMPGTGTQPLKGHSSPSLFSAHVYCGHGRPSQLLLTSCFASCVTPLLSEESLYVKRRKMSVVRSYVRNCGRGQLSSGRRHNENDVTVTIAGLWRYGDWRHVATG